MQCKRITKTARLVDAKAGAIAEEPLAEFKDAVLAFYRQHDPANVSNVDRLVVRGAPCFSPCCPSPRGYTRAAYLPTPHVGGRGALRH